MYGKALAFKGVTTYQGGLCVFDYMSSDVGLLLVYCYCMSVGIVMTV